MLVLFRLIVLAMAAAVVVMGQQPIPDDLATIRGFVKDHCENNTASFLGAHGPIETWNVSLVTDMNDLFDDADSLCNPDITQWDVSNVKDMTEMVRVPAGPILCTNHLLLTCVWSCNPLVPRPNSL